MSALIKFFTKAQGTSNIALAAALAVLIQYASGLVGYDVPLEVAIAAGVVLAAIGKAE